MRKCLYIFAALSLFLLLAVTACKDDSTGSKDDPPAIPPSSASMVIDFSDFVQSSSLAKSSLMLSKQYWGRAAIIVLGWKIMLDGAMLIPVAAFITAVNQEPEKLDTGSWRWSYGFSRIGRSFSASLYGEINGNEIDWDMYISSEGIFTDFNWFSGTSMLDGSGGVWTFSFDPDSNHAFLQIDWQHDADAGTGSIRYTDISGGEGNGSYIEYGLTNDVTYNAYYILNDQPENNQIDIQWNTVTKAGRIKDPAYYGDTDWHYWDTNRDDI